jgi:UDP-N-acetylbacillosamine N-acetyltransferase
MTPVNELLVIGCGGHSRFLLGLIRETHFNVRGIIDLENDLGSSETIMGVSVIGCLNSIDEQYSLNYRDVVLGIGDNCFREATFNDLKGMGFKFPNLIHSTAVIDCSAKLGVGNVIGPQVVIGAEVKLGDNNIINSGAIVEHQSSIGNHNHISLSATICGKVSVGNGVLLGANSTVIEKIIISDYTTLGAGGTLISSTKTNGLTLVGCPAEEK